MYSCDTCHISFDDELTSVQHHKEFHSIGGRNEGQCMLCNVRFPSFPRFAEHFKKSHRKQTKLLTKGLHSKNDFPWLLKVAFREHGGGALSMDEMMDKNRQQLMQMGYESDDSEEDEDSGDIEIVASSPAPTEAFLDDNEAEMDDGVIELTEEQEMKPRTKMSTTEELQKLYHEDRANENESIPIGRKREQPLDPPVTVKRSRGLSSLDPNIPYAKALNSSSSQKVNGMMPPAKVSMGGATTTNPFTSNVSVPDAGHTNAVPMTRIDLKEMLERQKNIIIHFPPDWTDDERRKTFQAIQAVANEKSAGAQ